MQQLSQRGWGKAFDVCFNVSKEVCMHISIHPSMSGCLPACLWICPQSNVTHVTLIFLLLLFQNHASKTISLESPEFSFLLPEQLPGRRPSESESGRLKCYILILHWAKEAFECWESPDTRREHSVHAQFQTHTWKPARMDGRDRDQWRSGAAEAIMFWGEATQSLRTGSCFTGRALQGPCCLGVCGSYRYLLHRLGRLRPEFVELAWSSPLGPELQHIGGKIGIKIGTSGKTGKIST